VKKAHNLNGLPLAHMLSTGAVPDHPPWQPLHGSLGWA